MQLHLDNTSSTRPMAEHPKEARKALQKLADQITCAICLETYSDPKLLPCLHIFCKHCLERLVIQKGSSETVSCPECRQTARLPHSGIADFRSAFFVGDFVEGYTTLKKALENPTILCDKCPDSEAVGFCKDCGKFVCDFCSQVHKKWPELSGHTIVSVPEIQANATKHITPKKGMKYCGKHPDEQLKIFCETCSMVICRDCILGDHRDHKYHLVSEVAPKHKEQILACVQPMKEQLEIVAAAVASVDAKLKEVCVHGDRAQNSIQKMVDELHGALEVRGTELIHQVKQIVQEKTKRLAAQKEQQEMLHARAASCLDFIDRSLQSATDVEILNIEGLILDQAKEVTSSLENSQLQPIEDASVWFSVNTIIANDCRRFGNVYAQQLCPARCYATGEGLKKTLLGETTAITLHVISEDGNECTIPVKNITCKMVSSMNDDGSVTVTKANVIKQERNTYKLSLTPHIRGTHALHIKIHGKYIQGSPHELFVYNSKPITISSVVGAYGVAITEDGCLVVTESKAQCTSFIRRDSKKLRCLENKDSTIGTFNNPRGTAIDSDGNILVSDDHRIQKFSMEGTFIASVGSTERRSTESDFNSPRGIAVNSRTGRIYVADRDNHRIQVLDKDLTHLHQFGGEGSQPSQLNYPFDVAVAKDGTVYVADTYNHRIQVFTADGNYLQHIGTKGSQDGQLQNPFGVSVDLNQNVFVTDAGNRRISIFNSRGNFITSISNHWGFHDLRGIAVDQNGFICVPNFQKNYIQIF